MDVDGNAATVCSYRLMARHAADNRANVDRNHVGVPNYWLNASMSSTGVYKAYACVVQRQETTVLEAVQCGFESLHTYQLRCPISPMAEAVDSKPT